MLRVQCLTSALKFGMFFMQVLAVDYCCLLVKCTAYLCLEFDNALTAIASSTFFPQHNSS